MRAGELRHRVTFQSMVETEDDLGAPNPTYDDYVTVWAEVIYTQVGSREFWQAQQANSEAHGTVRIRHRADITPEMRVKYGTKFLHILVPFSYDPKNNEMHILFKEALG